MRVSMMKDDPGFANYDPNFNYIIEVDGKRITGVTTFDTDEGMVLHYATTLNGGAIVRADDTLQMAVTTGNVTFTKLPAVNASRATEELVQQEREKYERVWQENRYRAESPGLRHIDRIIDELGLVPRAVVVDFGCGGGVTGAALQQKGFQRVIGIDIAENANASVGFPVIVCPIHNAPYLQQVDAAYCIDVMEHIPEELVDASLRRIADISPLTYFRIALFEDSFGQTIGVGPLHMTVKSRQWWLDTLLEVFPEVNEVPSGEPNIFAAICSKN